MPVWVIKIVDVAAGGPAAFQPDLAGAKPGQPLGIRGDENSVTWRNNTDIDHWPWPTNGQGGAMLDEQDAKNRGVYLTENILPGDVSAPRYTVNLLAGSTIFYCCRHHAHEQGSIVRLNSAVA